MLSYKYISCPFTPRFDELWPSRRARYASVDVKRSFKPMLSSFEY